MSWEIVTLAVVEWDSGAEWKLMQSLYYSETKKQNSIYFLIYFNKTTYSTTVF